MPILHPIPPIYDAQSRVLILGSFPSAASRAGMFFYHHPQNRFWPLMAALLGEPVPGSVEDKTAMLLRHHVALWDSAASCEIEGSADASMRDVVPNDLSPIFAAAGIRAVFCNGAAAWQIYHKHIEPKTGLPATKLPSTSPANAAWSLPRLQEAWSGIASYLVDVKQQEGLR